jgi:hypothetical protein
MESSSKQAGVVLANRNLLSTVLTTRWDSLAICIPCSSPHADSSLSHDISLKRPKEVTNCKAATIVWKTNWKTISDGSA